MFASETESVVSVRFFVPYARLQFWADLLEIWRVASL